MMMTILLVTSGIGFSQGNFPEQTKQKIVETTLNGLKISIDVNTGSIIKLQRVGGIVMLEADPEYAGLIDVAYPVKQFDPLRLASRFSEKPEIRKTTDGLTITWHKLGASREKFEQPGNVSCIVTITEADDGQSVILKAKIENQSEISVRQVLFPDFAGLLPFAGEEDTELRNLWYAHKPFPVLKALTRESKNFRRDRSANQVMPLNSRWLDYGGLQGGFSLYQRAWGFAPFCKIMQDLRYDEKSLRLMLEHQVTIEPQQEWESGEFYLTPHIGGWAKGIETYREWVSQNQKRDWPLSRPVRDGLGMRVVWMCDNYIHDPKDVVWKINDLPAIANEAKEHGLTAIHMWQWHEMFKLPLPPPFPHLGTEEELSKAAIQCQKIGVRLVPMIEWSTLAKDECDRYGFRHQEVNWMGHNELIPRFRPYYTEGWGVGSAGDSHYEPFLNDILDSWKHLIDLGIPSIFWDQFWSGPKVPNFQTTARKGIELSKKKDPESIFIIEDFWNHEVTSVYGDLLDATVYAQETEAFVNAFSGPRPYWLIDQKRIDQLKKCFANNFFFEVGPTSKRIVTGSDWIEDHPELSRVLKDCASLRKQFLPYFTRGVFIGDCILSEPCNNAHVSAYVLSDKILIIAINLEEPQSIVLNCNLNLWLESKAQNYQIKSYNESGKMLEVSEYHKKQELWTPNLKNLEIAIFEVIPGN